VAVFQMARTARRIVETVLGVREGEEVVIVTDTEVSPRITDVLATEVMAAGARPLVLRMLPHHVGGEEPLPAVTAAIHAASAVILQDSYALVHTDAFRGAMARGVRLVELWGATEDMMVRGGLMADYRQVGRVTAQVEAAAKDARTVRLTSPAGTDFTAVIAGRPRIPLTGEALYAGSFCSLPGGELAISPLEGTAEGVLVDPFLLERKELAYRRDPLRIEVRAGQVVDVRGGREAAILRAMLEEAGPTARNIAEVAVGTNAWCRPYESLREAKKALGTAHVAIGDNRTLGGDVTSPLHMDMIFDRCTLAFDDRPVLAEGRFLLAEAQEQDG
jgi:leucyl aminopeptidase (aminopeptidase T)